MKQKLNYIQTYFKNGKRYFLPRSYNNKRNVFTALAFEVFEGNIKPTEIIRVEKNFLKFITK